LGKILPKKRVTFVKGINQTFHNTNLRQTCNTCRN